MTPILVLLVSLLLAPAVALGAPADWSEHTFEVRGPTTESIVVLESPAVDGDRYAVTGTVAYEGVEGVGYLEMWSVFPDGSRYFSRTLADMGPMAKLQGSSRERAFFLPFSLQPDSPRPVRLEVNVVLPAGGHVTLRGLRFGSGEDALSTPGAWWSAQTAGWIGSAAGSAAGVAGALLGTLCFLGRGRRIVMAGLAALAGAGLVALAVGGVAVAFGQPYAVWFPLVQIGVIAAAVGFSVRASARRRFEALELRRMQAHDLRA